MSAHLAVAAIVGRHVAQLAHAAASRPPAVATAGQMHQPGDLVIDSVTGKEAQVVYGSRETVFAPAPEGSAG
jgi:hypothetical protein